MSLRANRLLLAAATLGLGLAGSALVHSSADASPLNGGKPIGHHGGWKPHHGHGPHLPVWAHRRPHGHFGPGYWGVVRVGYPYAYGPRCRLVERENRWGEIVVRRVCRPPVW